MALNKITKSKRGRPAKNDGPKTARTEAEKAEIAAKAKERREKRKELENRRAELLQSLLAELSDEMRPEVIGELKDAIEEIETALNTRVTALPEGWERQSDGSLAVDVAGYRATVAPSGQAQISILDTFNAAFALPNYTQSKSVKLTMRLFKMIGRILEPKDTSE